MSIKALTAAGRGLSAWTCLWKPYVFQIDSLPFERQRRIADRLVFIQFDLYLIQNILPVLVP